MNNVVEFPQKEEVLYEITVLECNSCECVVFAMSIDGAHCLECGNTNTWDEIAAALENV